MLLYDILRLSKGSLYSFEVMSIYVGLEKKRNLAVLAEILGFLNFSCFFSFYLVYHKKLQNFKIQQPLHQN